MGTFNTYAAANEMRESLLSILKDVSPNESNYFVSNLSKGPAATQVYQEWNTYYDARPTSVTLKAQGGITQYGDLTAEGRTGNYTAIVEEPVRVSRTKASIAMVTGEDAVTTEKGRALRRLKAQMEFITLRGAGTSAGLSGVPASFAGIDKCISTNVTVRATDTSFTYQEFNDMIQESWTGVSEEYVANLLVCPIVIKRRAANFGTNLTRNIDASSKRLTQEVRVIDSEVGPTVMILAHKDVVATQGNLKVYAIDEKTFAHSFLVDSGEPHWEDRAKDGDYVNGTYLSEFSVISFAQRANVMRSGYATTL
jgi:hypothetical protein